MRYWFTIACMCVALYGGAQDLHFSQFYATPLSTNPALTGHFPGTYRFHAITRSQWASVSPQPYQSFAGSVDINAPFGLRNTGVGLFASHDFAGLSALTTTQAYASISAKIPFGTSGLALHLGGMGGFFQTSIDFTKLTFDDQFNGIRFDPNLLSQQPLSGAFAITNLNFSGGAFLEYRRSERARLGLGGSAFNLTEPDKMFFKSVEFKTYRRYNAHMLSSIPLGGWFDLMPAVQFQMQGPHRELVLGTAFRFHLSTSIMNPRSVQFGVWGRTGDAAIASIGFQMGDLTLGGSYDLNLSNLQPATQYRGGWEVSFIYIIPTVREKLKRIRQCPDYL
jgi:type IX secretion system PorP/SprF family membrane protein